MHYYEKRKRKGVTMYDARKQMRERNTFGAMLVEHGEADALVSGLTKDYPKTILPALQVIGMEKEVNKVAGMYIIIIRDKVYFFADTTVNIDPTAEQLAKIGRMAAEVAETHGNEPRVAMVSFSNFTGRTGTPRKMVQAAKLLKEMRPDLHVEGEMQADTAVNSELLTNLFPFADFNGKSANVLVFPNLEASNISYKLLQQLSDAEVLGPFLMGVGKPTHVLQRTTTVDSILNSIALTVHEVQTHHNTVHG